MLLRSLLDLVPYCHCLLHQITDNYLIITHSTLDNVGHIGVGKIV